jgi:hypothetical protein
MNLSKAKLSACALFLLGASATVPAAFANVYTTTSDSTYSAAEVEASKDFYGDGYISVYDNSSTSADYGVYDFFGGNTTIDSFSDEHGSPVAVSGDLADATLNLYQSAYKYDASGTLDFYIGTDNATSDDDFTTNDNEAVGANGSLRDIAADTLPGGGDGVNAAQFTRGTTTVNGTPFFFLGSGTYNASLATNSLESYTFDLDTAGDAALDSYITQQLDNGNELRLFVTTSGTAADGGADAEFVGSTPSYDNYSSADVTSLTFDTKAAAPESSTITYFGFAAIMIVGMMFIRRQHKNA